MNVVETWSQETQSVLAPKKYESSWLTTDNRLTKYEPVMTLNLVSVQVNRHPEFLGVKFDRLLHFT